MFCCVLLCRVLSALIAVLSWLELCCRVLFYRDCRASAQIQLAKCGVPGQAPLISAPYQLATDWSDPAFVAAAPAGLDGDGGW